MYPSPSPSHIDQRDAALPLDGLRDRYPRILGHYEVSNLEATGIEKVRAVIADAAAGLPLMGEQWPETWLGAAETIRAAPERHATPGQLEKIFTDHQVAGVSCGVLARWLHELGDILYFPDDEELRDLVILKPQWVTAYISRVLESEDVIGRLGIFTRAHMDELWSELEKPMRDHFLNLMERFDLSYKTLEDRDISLVVERLPLDPPDFVPQWEETASKAPCHEIAMRFELSTVPAGIPTWFIARSHRFTTRTHWRSGALFADGPDHQHLALARAFAHDRFVELTVRGPNPHNFFALLKDGLELTLERFPGLRIRRKIPCPGHDGEPCPHRFDYQQLLKRVHKKPTIECPESFDDVPVAQLLFGLHWSTQDVVLSRLDRLEGNVEATVEAGRDAILDELADLRELTQRQFTRAYRREQSKIDSHCPNVFTLRPRASGAWRKTLSGETPSRAGCHGLRKILSPEGHYLWLCDEHAALYAR